jgi:hypothetical protein
MTPQRHTLERLQRATRVFAFGYPPVAVDDTLPATFLAAQAFAAGLAPAAAGHAFPVRAGTFTPWRLKEAA